MSLHPFRPSLVSDVCLACGRSRVGGGHGYELPEPAPVARTSDHDTSWQAARSVRNVRASQIEILTLFRLHGPMTDEEARARYSGRQSLSGFRTRRAELVDRGLLRDSGQRKPGTTGRRMIVWTA